MFKITEPGIFTDVPEADYYADPCLLPSLTQSIAKVLIDHSALHARAEHPRFAEPEAEDEPAEKYVAAQAIGNAAHKALIGRGKEIAVGEFDSWRSDPAKKFRAAAELAGQTAILTKHMNTAHDMVLAARMQIMEAANALDEPALHQAFKEGSGEVVAAALVDGVWMRSLIDWMVNPRILFDFKSTGLSVAPHAIDNLMSNAGWPIQAAMQERILDVLDPEGAGRRRFFFVAQENWKPYALTIHELPEATMTIGRKMVSHAETIWRDAMLNNRWTGYPIGINRPQYPQYVETKWLAREIEHEERRTAAPGEMLKTDLRDIRMAG
jgi:hypothetical protein